MDRIRRLCVRYGPAALFVGAITGVRLSMTDMVGREPAFLLFLGAVMAASWIGGAGPGLFATVLSLLSVDYFFLAPFYSIDIPNSETGMPLALFAIEACVIAILAGKLHRARDAALAGQAEARSLQAELLRVSDDERRRIGHDLHDGLGQQLTGVALLSKVLGQRLAERQMPESREAQQIATLANEMIGQTKHLARGLDPISIQPDGLMQALSELCDSVSRVFGVNCLFDSDAIAIACEPATAQHLFRIAQEAVSNAVKHGKPKTIRVELQQDDDAIVLTVRNDGVPFRPPTNGSGMGLRIMNHRAKMIGATLDVDLDSSGQTILTCRLPT